MQAAEIVTRWRSRWPGLTYHGVPESATASTGSGGEVLVRLRADANGWRDYAKARAPSRRVPDLDAAEALLRSALADLNKRTAEAP